jgi:hypothetical protein
MSIPGLPIDGSSVDSAAKDEATKQANEAVNAAKDEATKQANDAVNKAKDEASKQANDAIKKATAGSPIPIPIPRLPIGNPIAGDAGTRATPEVDSTIKNLETAITAISEKAQKTLMFNGQSAVYTSIMTNSTSESIAENYPYLLSIVDMNSDENKAKKELDDLNDALDNGSDIPEWNGPSGNSDTTQTKTETYKTVTDYILPINPQELSIQTPFAIKTTVTSGGILEEHNGAPIKMITINGTTGHRISRPVNFGNITDSTKSSFSDSIKDAFRNTIDATDRVSKSMTNFKDALSGKDTVASEDIKYTGYYQYHMLRLFLETYAEAKKYSEYSGWRLVLRIPKDKIDYIVTPQMFTTRKSVASPNEYLYSIQMLAWAQLPDNQMETVRFDNNKAASYYSRAVTSLKRLRSMVNSFKDVVGAFKNDIDVNILGPINNVILLGKDITGLAKTVFDFPVDIKNMLKDPFKNALLQLNEANLDLAASRALFELKIYGVSETRSSAQPSLNTSKNPPPMKKMQDPVQNEALADKIAIPDLQVNSNQQKAIDAAVSAAKDQGERDFRKLIRTLEATYRAVEPLIVTKDPTEPEWELLYALKDSIASLHSLIVGVDLATSANEKESANLDSYLEKTALAFWQGQAALSNINFTKPDSKIAVPFPYKITLEQLSATYLGSPERWIEIAALNGLQAPYVDEEGFSYKLTANGSANQITIGSADNLYIGQSVYLSSDTELTVNRKIQQIIEISPNNWIVTLNGPLNLSNLKIAENAQIKAYLPYTINSLNQIYIPSKTRGVSSNASANPITYTEDSLDFVKFSKIDLLLDSKGDLAITGNGFLNLAFGKTNLFQAAKMIMSTPRGSLLLHPEFGGGIEVGTSDADFNPPSTIARISSSFSADGRFKSPSMIKLTQDSGSILLDLTVPLANGSGFLPVAMPLKS